MTPPPARSPFRALLLRVFRSTPAPTSLEEFKNAPPLCNGEATGKQCVHYLSQIAGFGGQADSLDERLGRSRLPVVRRQRRCLLNAPEYEDLGNAGSRFRVACSAYEASSRRFDPTFEALVAGPSADEKAYVETGVVQPPAPPLSEFAAVGGSQAGAEKHALEALLANHGIRRVTPPSDPTPPPGPAPATSDPATTPTGDKNV